MLASILYRCLLLAAVWISAVFLSPLLSSRADEASSGEEGLSTNSVLELESIQRSLDTQLDSISQYNLRSGVGAIGYRSQAHPTTNHPEWFEVKLEAEAVIDEVVLIPSVRRDGDSSYVGDGFPIGIRVTLGTGSGETRKTVAVFEANDCSPLRVAPLVISSNRTNASWVRIEADQLSQREYDDKYLFQFSELMVFSNFRNLALRQTVEASSNEPTGSPAWDSSYAVDGFMPYLMNSSRGHGTLPFVSAVGIGDAPSVTIDLKQTSSVSRVNLHLVDQGDTVPQSFGGNFGVPRSLKIEGAQKLDFSDAQLLCEYKHENMFDCGPILLLQFPAHQCRYVRLTATDPYLYEVEKLSQFGSRIGFAEIEVFSDHENLALSKPVLANFKHDAQQLFALVDGNNRYGEIIPIRNWLSELSARNTIEAKRPLVAAELKRRNQKQRRNFRWMIGLAGALALSVIVISFAGWQLGQRAVAKTREQIAADFHDELGANVHAMALLSDMARASSEDPERLNQLLVRMRELSDRTGKAAASFGNMLESEWLCDDLIEEMRRASNRITADIEHQFDVTGEQNLSLNRKRSIGLFLFYKECLTNALRHSQASQLKTNLNIQKNEIQLEVADNGIGLPDAPSGKAGPLIPQSLRRRARLLGGKVTIQHLESGGTKVRLVLR